MNKIHPDTSINWDYVTLGDNIRIEAGTRIGTQSMTINKNPFTGHNVRLEAEKGVIIEDGVDIGCNSSVHRGLYRDTIIKRNAFIGSHCSIGHGCYVGENAQIADGSKFMGDVTIMPEVYIGACTEIRENAVVGAYSYIGMGTLITRDIPPGSFGYGRPFKPKERTKK